MNKLKNKLNELLDLSLVEVKRDGSDLVFEFKNGTCYRINPDGDKSGSGGGKNLKTQSFVDPGFRILSHVALKEPFEEDPMGHDPIIQANYKALIQVFSKNNNTTKDQQVKNYRKLFNGHLKEFFSKSFNLGLDPKKEFFLFGNDEFAPRFHIDGRDAQLADFMSNIESGKQVIILDKSAYIFDGRSGRHIDLNTHHYMDEKFLYLGKITQMVELSEKPQDGSEYSVMFNGKNNSRKYLKQVLKEGVDLSKETNKIPYQKAEGLELTLFKQGNDFLFKDQTGEIRIDHPDLLIQLLD